MNLSSVSVIFLGSHGLMKMVLRLQDLLALKTLLSFSICSMILPLNLLIYSVNFSITLIWSNCLNMIIWRLWNGTYSLLAGFYGLCVLSGSLSQKVNIDGGHSVVFPRSLWGHQPHSPEVFILWQVPFVLTISIYMANMGNLIYCDLSTYWEKPRL